MKIRIKFTKTGSLKFIGHLDVMRYFQKLNRRAGVDISYSQGFNPHQLMSFAQPLGLGLTSEGEYVDITVNSSLTSKEAIALYNEHSVPEIRILSYKKLYDENLNAMSQVAGADYIVSFRQNLFTNEELSEKFSKFMANPQIIYEKTSKKTTRTLDIKPFIYKWQICGNKVKLQLSTGSALNLKPEAVLDAFFAFIGMDFNEYMLIIHRTEVYGMDEEAGNKELIPLEDFGEDIE